jgi:hypothetical protein
VIWKIRQGIQDSVLEGSFLWNSILPKIPPCWGSNCCSPREIDRIQPIHSMLSFASIVQLMLGAYLGRLYCTDLSTHGDDCKAEDSLHRLILIASIGSSWSQVRGYPEHFDSLWFSCRVWRDRQCIIRNVYVNRGICWVFWWLLLLGWVPYTLQRGWYRHCDWTKGLFKLVDWGSRWSVHIFICRRTSSRCNRVLRSLWRCWGEILEEKWLHQTFNNWIFISPDLNG